MIYVESASSFNKYCICLFTYELLCLFKRNNMIVRFVLLFYLSLNVLMSFLRGIVEESYLLSCWSRILVLYIRLARYFVFRMMGISLMFSYFLVLIVSYNILESIVFFILN